MPASWAIVGVMWYYLKTNKHSLSGRLDYLIRAHTAAEGQANKSRDKALGWYHQTLGFLCPLKPNKKIRVRVWESSVSGEETQLPRASRTVHLPSGVWEVCLPALGWSAKRWRSDVLPLALSPSCQSWHRAALLSGPFVSDLLHCSLLSEIQKERKPQGWSAVKVRPDRTWLARS